MKKVVLLLLILYSFTINAQLSKTNTDSIRPKMSSKRHYPESAGDYLDLSARQFKSSIYCGVAGGAIFYYGATRPAKLQPPFFFGWCHILYFLCGTAF